MAEISETTPQAASNPSSSHGSSSNCNSSQRNRKPGTKRLFLTLSVLFFFLAVIPFLLKSTEIYRSPLPFTSISSLSSCLHSHPPSFPCRFHAVFLSPSPSPHSLSSAISSRLGSHGPSSSSCNNATISVTVDSSGGRCESSGSSGGTWKCGALDGIEFDDDEAVDELLDSRIGGSGGARVYTVVVIAKEEAEEVRVVVGNHRHAWIVGRVSKEEVVEMIVEIFVKLFVRGAREVMPQGEEDEFMPVGLDGSVVLSFSLLNADPSDWVYDWEMQKIDTLILAPVVEALAPIANISLESQVLYHTPKASISSWDDKLDSYVFSTRDLPFFVCAICSRMPTSFATSKWGHF